MTDFLERAPLQPGDTVRMISPAGAAPADLIDQAMAVFTEWGLRVELGENARATHPRASYLAGSDAQRRDDFVEAWTDPLVRAVVALRGGYGTLRILDGIDWSRLRAARGQESPLLVGSSDLTALHEAVRSRLGAPTLFAPMPATGVFHSSATIAEDVRSWLVEPWGDRLVQGARTSALVAGRTRGRFGGGNLSLLAAATGAPESDAPPGEILFLEDVTEEPYRLDGYLTQLRRSGRLTRAGAIVCGSWESCGDPDAVRALILDETADLGVPVLWDQGFGHAADAGCVPFGVTGEVVAAQDRVEVRVVGG